MAALAASVAELRLGRWDTISRRVLARLVPTARAGPLALALPTVARGRAAVALDVGIDLPSGIVRLDRALVAALGVHRREVWRAALANLARLAPPATTSLEPGWPALSMVAGGPWTSGQLLRPDLPNPTSGLVRPDRGRDGPGALVVVAPRPEVAVIGRVGATCGAEQGRGGVQRIGTAAVMLARRLAEVDGGPLLPPVPIVVDSTGSFPARWILE